MANSHFGNGEVTPASARLTSSASLKHRKKQPGHSRVGSEVEDFVHMLHGSDPVRVELTRLENEVRGFLFHALTVKFSPSLSVLIGICELLLFHGDTFVVDGVIYD